jgi:type VI secretion system secreted protein Hcp
VPFGNERKEEKSVAAVDFFLKIEGIEGESQDHKHKNEIHIQSWSWGESNSGSAAEQGGAGSGKVDMQDFHFVCTLGKQSPKLFLACATGDHLKKAALVCRKAGKQQQEYFTINFTEMLISSYQVGGSTNSIIPTDQISFNFAKVEFEYKEQKPDGTLGGSTKAGYDLKQQKQV